MAPSKAPAATWSTTGWASPEPGGALMAPRPSCGLRVIHANGDHDAYWHHHIRQEHQRNHLSRYHDGLELAAA
jgi:hypothetical protein